MFVDCVYRNGCNGGNQETAFDYAKKHAAMKEGDYPYKGTAGTCKVKTGVVSVKSWGNVTKKSTSALKSALNKQPIAVSIDASSRTFGNYSSGIITSGCGTSLDHAVLAVGYGSNYFIVKNSWGTSWGEKGYVRMGFADGAGICGIQLDPLSVSTN